MTLQRSLLLWLFVSCLFWGCADDQDPKPSPGDATPDVVTRDDMDASRDMPVDQEPDTSKPVDMSRDTTEDVSDETPDVVPDVVEPDMVEPDAEMDIVVTELRADSLIPPRGPIVGGTSFVISGVGFTDNTVVFFGGRPTDVDLVDGTLVGESPAGVAPGAVDVKILDPMYGNDSLAGGFTYTSTLEVLAVSPGRVTTDGGVEVEVSGLGFDNDTRLSFGGATALRHTLVNDRLIRAVTPPGTAGPADVRATNLDATHVLYEGLTYYDALRIDSVRPATGGLAGGDDVTIHGAGFVAGSVVEFGGRAATVQSVSASGDEIQVKTPAASAPGLVSVRVETPSQDAAFRPDAFLYSDSASVEVAAVDPATGPASGGTSVTLTGKGLNAAGLTVTFGGVPAMITEQGEGHVVVKIPAHAEGAVDIVVSDGSSSDTLSGAFTYVRDLWIDRVTPNISDVAGGVSVVIDGDGYTGLERVLFGGIPGSFTVDSEQKVTAMAPAHSAGVFDVELERDGISARLRDGFTYTEDLNVFGFYPVRGSVAGGTYVEIRGRGFVGNLTVTFGGQPGSDVVILDSQTLGVRTPPGMTGQVDIEVKRGADTAQPNDPFTYFNPGARFGGAWGSPIAGAVNVTVYSLGGSPVENAFVMLSTRADTRYQGFTDANGMLTLSGPDVYGEQTITAVAAMHSSATVQRVDAENITIFLLEYVPPSMGPPPPSVMPATYKGKITGLNKLAEPSPSQFKMAVVTTTQTDRARANPNPGPGSVILADGDYVLTSRLGDLAIVALGGVYDNNTQTFTPMAMGVKRYQFASEGQQYTVDLDLNIPLNRTMSVKMNTVPTYAAGPDGTRVKPWMDFGFEGVFGELKVATGPAGATSLPVTNLANLTGQLADVTYYIEGGAYTNGDGPPLSVGVRDGITDPNQQIVLPGLLDVAQVTSPVAMASPTNGLVQFTYNSSRTPDLFYARVMIPTPGGLVPYWDAVLPGTARSFRLPDFPDFSALPLEQRPAPYQNEVYPLLIYAVEKPGLDFNNFNYGDFGIDTWDAYSLTVHYIRL